MALTKPFPAVQPKSKPGTWKDRMPKRITAEDAKKEPLNQRLFR